MATMATKVAIIPILDLTFPAKVAGTAAVNDGYPKSLTDRFTGRHRDRKLLLVWDPISRADDGLQYGFKY